MDRRRCMLSGGSLRSCCWPRLTGFVQMALINVVLILGFFMTIQGLAVGWFYLRGRR